MNTNTSLTNTSLTCGSKACRVAECHGMMISKTSQKALRYASSIGKGTGHPWRDEAAKALVRVLLP